MDREEKLRVAKEKLKKFQKKRQEEVSRGTPEPRKDEPQPPPLRASPQIPIPNGLDSGVETKNFSEEHEVADDDQLKVRKKHASLSEQIAGVLSSGGYPNDDNESEELKRKVHQQAAAISQLELQCRTLSDNLESSEAKLGDERKAFEVLLAAEKDALAQKLKSQSESIQILVAEKTDLDRLLDKVHASAAEKDDEISKLKAAAETAKATAAATAPSDRRQGEDEEAVGLRQEVEELSSRCVSKDAEVSSLRSQLSHMKSRMEMAEVNLSQMRSATGAEDLRQKDEEIERLVKDNEGHQERVKELTSYIQKATEDREQIIRQYTSYSQQLTSQIESLTAELNEAKVTNHGLACREADLVTHVQRLEEQLQQLMVQLQQHQRQQANSRDESQTDEGEVASSKRISELEKKVKDLENSLKEAQGLNDSIQEEKHDQEEKVEELSKRLHEAQEQLSDAETKLEMERTKGGADMAKQVADCQSDKIAASRAMTQNVNLKRQLEELELAVIQTTNSKAAVATELESLKLKEQTWAESEKKMALELRGLKETVSERDRSIGQLKEQINYYINFAENSINGHLDGNPRNTEAEHEEQVQKLIKELQDAKETIGRLTSSQQPPSHGGSGEVEETLRRQLNEANFQVRSLNSLNSELRSQLEVLSMRTTESSGTPSSSTNGGCAPAASGEVPEAELSTASSSSHPSPHHVCSSVSVVDNNSVPPLSPEVALLKLEQKFREAMMRNVELMNEKERLEHIVVQLQDETDTVGEYVTIYQYQRTQQKLRLQEKEKQLQTLSRERETLKSKLGQLESVIKAFVQEKSSKGGQRVSNSTSHRHEDAGKNGSTVHSATSGTLSNENSVEPSASGAAVEAGEDAGGKTKASECNGDGGDENQQVPTADKILALISEIGSNQILGDSTFHPWFWEAQHGKVMTV